MKAAAAWAVTPTLLDARRDSFLRHVRYDGACEVWTGAMTRGGYGIFALGRIDGQFRAAMAHQFAWWLANGQRVPSGYELDHTCHRPECVTVAHLEVVTHEENNRRRRNGVARTAHCPHGHARTPENALSYRHANGRTYVTCRPCHAETARNGMRRRRGTLPINYRGPRAVTFADAHLNALLDAAETPAPQPRRATRKAVAA